jgi:hypothetical protein
MKPTLLVSFLLLSCASAFSADGAPPVFLSHFYIALDQTTYDALRTSKQVAALGAVKEQKVVAGSRNWSGFYWTGRQTYMEFFGAAELPDEMRLGDCGLGLEVETQGGVAAVASRLRTAFGDKIEIEKQVRRTATGNIPWYMATDIKTDGPEAMAMWIMEVDSGYLAAKHPESRVRDPLSRQQYNSWDFRPDQALDNVVGLTLALNQDKTSELATEFELFGWAVHRTGAGFFAIGPGVKISVIPAGARAGIQKVELRLSRPVPKQTIQLGNAELQLDGNTGQLVVWKSE